MDKRALWAMVHRVAKSQTWLKQLSTYPIILTFPPLIWITSVCCVHNDWFSPVLKVKLLTCHWQNKPFEWLSSNRDRSIHSQCPPFFALFKGKLHTVTWKHRKLAYLGYWTHNFDLVADTLAPFSTQKSNSVTDSRSLPL